MALHCAALAPFYGHDPRRGTPARIAGDQTNQEQREVRIWYTVHDSESNPILQSLGSADSP